jgi:uncharacterized protein YdaU (DUF1376 family)
VNYYRRYVGDYLRDTSRLSMLEHGAYGLLLDYYYAEERPISLDMDEVCRMCRAITAIERAAIDKVLRLYFSRRVDGWHQKRVDLEIAAATSARENGAKGGRPRKTEHETGTGTEEETGSTTGRQTEQGGEGVTGSGHPPTTNHQPPSASLQPPAGEKTRSRFALPDWVPPEPWSGWLEMRSRKKTPNTERALKLALGKLEELRKAGQNLAAVIDQSTTRGWTTFYPVKANGTVQSGDAQRAAREQAATELFGEPHAAG